MRTVLKNHEKKGNTEDGKAMQAFVDVGQAERSGIRQRIKNRIYDSRLYHVFDARAFKISCSKIFYMVVLFSFVSLLCVLGGGALAEDVTATGWKKSLWFGWEKMEIFTNIKGVMWHEWISDDIIWFESTSGLFELDIKTLDVKKSERKPDPNGPYSYSRIEDKYYTLDWTKKKQIKLSNGKIIKLSDFKKYFPNRPGYPFIIVYDLDGFVFANVDNCKVSELVLLRYDTKRKEDLFSLRGGAFCYLISDGETCNGFIKPEISKSGIIAFIDNCVPNTIILLRKKMNS